MNTIRRMQYILAPLYIIFEPFYIVKSIVETIYAIYIFCNYSATMVIYLVRLVLRCLSLVITGFLWIFFNCTFPIFVHCVNAFGWICLKIITFETRFVDVPAILMGISIVAIIYYEKVDTVYRLVKDSWQLTIGTVRSGFSFIEMVTDNAPLLYRRLMSAISTLKNESWDAAHHFKCFCEHVREWLLGSAN